MSDDINDDDSLPSSDEFSSDKEREEFEKLWARYKQGKEVLKFASEYYKWLGAELQDHGYAIVPEKYTHIPNLPLCLVKLEMFPHTLAVVVLN